MKEKYAVKERRAPRVPLAQALRGKIEDRLTIGQRIEVVRQSGKSDAARFIHETAILVLRHTKDTGDCSSALPLVLAMHPSPRRDKLINWFASYSPIIVHIKKSKARLCAKDSKTYREFDLVMADRHPFEPCP